MGKIRSAYLLLANNKVKISYSLLLLILLSSTNFLYAAPPYPAAKLAQDSAFGERSLININNISTWIRRDGWSARHPLRVNFSGTTFPRSTSQVVYQDGLVWGGKVKDGDAQIVRVGGQTFEIGTVPGRILARGVAEERDDPSVRIYRVRRDYQTADLRLDTAELLDIGLSEVSDADIDQVRAQYERDWRDWPWQKGAPFHDRDGDGTYDPAIDAPSFRHADCSASPDLCATNADQIAWFVINDLDAGATAALYGAKPIGLEVQHTLWGYARTDALGDVIFKKYKVLYKGTAATPDTAHVDSMYFAMWIDPDIGDFGNDFAGSDLDLSLGYAYNATAEDARYRAFDLPPPAVGYDLLQGPIVPGEGAEAIFDFQTRPGYRNLPMTSFVFFAAGSAIDDPALGEYTGTQEWYNLLRGYQPQPNINNPVPYTDPLSGEDTFFTLSGDPLRDRGWTDGIPLPAGDRRIVMNTGPFNMALGDTQEVVVALTAGLGSDRLRSVGQLKFNDRFAQGAFDDFFAVPAPPAAPKVRAAASDRAISLDWGFDLQALAATEEMPSGVFNFEGYNVYQFPAAEADLSQARKIATYDLQNGITTILGLQLDDTSGEAVRLPLQSGRDSGLQWVARIERDAFRDRPLANGQPYYFAVTAYSHNPDSNAMVTTLESPPQKIVVVPQLPAPGIQRPSALGDELSVVQIRGTGDAIVQPLVIDPSQLIDATYTVTFNADLSWNLLRDDTAALTNQNNIALDESYLALDGVQVKVGGLLQSAPATFTSAQVTVDADPSDGDLVFWGDGSVFDEFDDGHAATFWEEGGSADALLLGRDLEIRFTGIWNDERSVIVSGGSMATLAGIDPGSAERSLDAHPLRPAGAPATGPFLQQVPFEIWDVEDPAAPRQLNAAFFDRGADGSRNQSTVAYHQTYNMVGRDYITVIATAYAPNQIHQLSDENATWVLFFRQSGASVWSTGDVLRLQFPSPIVPGEDKFQFTTRAESFSLQAARLDVDRINVFPNPYYGVNQAETSRHDHFVTFSHLPQKATIRIFDLSGNLVRTLAKDHPEQFFQWDLNNDNGLPVASGMYIAHIEMAEIGKTRQLKLAIIQEQQFLENF